MRLRSIPKVSFEKVNAPSSSKAQVKRLGFFCACPDIFDQLFSHDRFLLLISISYGTLYNQNYNIEKGVFMRKVFALILAVSLIALCSDAFAGGAGNCVEPIRTTTKHLGVGGAFEYNYVDERMNKLDNKDGAKDMKIEHVNQVYGKGIIGIGDYVNVYGKIGGSNYDLEFVDGAQGVAMVIDLKDGIYTGAGINMLFPITEIKEISIGIGADIQGNFFLNDVNGITRDGRTATSASGSFYGVDGQNSVYLTFNYTIDRIKTSIIPYVGGYQSWAFVGTAKKLTYETPRAGYVDKEHFQAAYDFLSFGPLLGIDVDIAEYVNLNVEGRFVGETAITTGATIKF